MTMITPDERGVVSIPPALLRQIGVTPESPVTVEISGTTLIVRPQMQQVREIEVYTPERKAELLLNNAVDSADYLATVAVVRAMGLDPDAIPHQRPTTADKRGHDVQTGAELIEYYQREQLIGTRSEIVDSQSHARALREAAEKRVRP